MLFGAVAAALVCGFLFGLLTFRLKQRWCRTCGSSLQCVDCLRRGQLGANVWTAL